VRSRAAAGARAPAVGPEPAHTCWSCHRCGVGVSCFECCAVTGQPPYVRRTSRNTCSPCHGSGMGMSTRIYIYMSTRIIPLSAALTGRGRPGAGVPRPCMRLAAQGCKVWLACAKARQHFAQVCARCASLGHAACILTLSLLGGERPWSSRHWPTRQGGLCYSLARVAPFSRPPSAPRLRLAAGVRARLAFPRFRLLRGPACQFRRMPDSDPSAGDSLPSLPDESEGTARLRHVGGTAVPCRRPRRCAHVRGRPTCCYWQGQ